MEVSSWEHHQYLSYIYRFFFKALFDHRRVVHSKKISTFGNPRCGDLTNTLISTAAHYHKK